MLYHKIQCRTKESFTCVSCYMVLQEPQCAKLLLTLDVPCTGSKYHLVSKWEHDDQMSPVLTRHTLVCILLSHYTVKQAVSWRQSHRRASEPKTCHVCITTHKLKLKTMPNCETRTSDLARIKIAAVCNCFHYSG